VQPPSLAQLRKAQGRSAPRNDCPGSRMSPFDLAALIATRKAP
jgi:hypothetical protein